MHLANLIKDIESLHVDGATDIDITGLSADSRQVKPGFLFAAFPGVHVDGRDYIAEALRKGAAAILVPQKTAPVESSGIWIESDNPRRAFAAMTAAFYNAQPETMAVVTGTNGKTSTVQFCQQIWADLGYQAGTLGTLGVHAPHLVRDGALTTPDPVTLHEALADLAHAGVTHAAMEASSIGMAQHRLDGVRVQAAGFTNLTRDHLDYHGTMDSYLAAKLRLFTDILTSDGTAVINADCDVAAQVLDVCTARGLKTIKYGRAGKDMTVLDQTPTPEGQSLHLRLFGKEVNVDLPLVGLFQAENALCALGLVFATLEDDAVLKDKAVQALGHLQTVRGRLELAGQTPDGAAVYIDYAHTPDGLETVLTSLRPHTQKQLHAVIGCGGDRDRGKRPMMGKVACDLADHVIVTDDNPRSEDPAAIRTDTMAGCPDAQNIGGRAQAIEEAILDLKAGDILVIAGKGHEQGQTIGDTVLPFDDLSEAKKILDTL